MGYGVSVLVKGDYALFSRPELKVERYSYDAITPSAARGILESIFWKPAIQYKIDQIYVINEISETNIRRNEVASKISASTVLSVMRGGGKPLYLNTSADIQQRASRILKNVCYVIDAHFELTAHANAEDTPEKFYNMILRRLRNGQHFHQPYLGCREFPAVVTLLENEPPPSYYAEQKRDLGLMLYDLDYSNPEDIHPLFFRCIMQDGIIDLRDCEVFG